MAITRTRRFLLLVTASAFAAIGGSLSSSLSAPLSIATLGAGTHVDPKEPRAPRNVPPPGCPEGEPATARPLPASPRSAGV
ncbi:hypothetical protein ACFWBN_02240 [Streptomyces sp. NPDC059989]|uniref:hypothetical protein n=1 Tax=Streptomyces sp. NPDC059989 TaxID=3347026 RepID=UPI003689830E